MDAFLRLLSRWLAGFACLSLLFVMVVTFIDVIGRYFFNSPLTFGVELVQLAMGLLVLFGMAITTLERRHIAVDLVEGLLPMGGKKLLAGVAALFCSVFIGLIAWRLWDRGINFLDDGLATDILFLPVWPVVLLMAFAAAVATLVALKQIFRPSIEREDLSLIVDVDP
ncbi:MAG: TRAP transporter small permease [Rhizobiaceae bacterium]|nr:TRAP transporter small permease [Rhizobiaceae bacterium]